MRITVCFQTFVTIHPEKIVMRVSAEVLQKVLLFEEAAGAGEDDGGQGGDGARRGRHRSGQEEVTYQHCPRTRVINRLNLVKI